MDGLVAVRSNATGVLSPTQEVRAAVVQQLAETAAVRSGERLAEQTVQAASSTQAGGTAGGSVGAAEQNALGKDAFLQLLVLQMKNQDPLNPQDNTAMVAQLAQFSALEAQTNLNEQFETLSGNVDQLNFISGSQLLGRTVTGLDVDGILRTGVVQSVHLDGSLVMLDVDGTLMSMASIYGIAAPVDSETPST
jgi:hypothetical protein